MYLVLSFLNLHTKLRKQVKFWGWDYKGSNSNFVFCDLCDPGKFTLLCASTASGGRDTLSGWDLCVCKNGVNH